MFRLLDHGKSFSRARKDESASTNLCDTKTGTGEEDIADTNCIRLVGNAETSASGKS